MSIEYEELWVEKYRPKTLDEIVDQKEVVERLKQFVKERNLPHLLFAGPPGTGKTTAALALARELYGRHWRENVLELNASVTPDTPVLVKIFGKIMRTIFGEVAEMYFRDEEERYVKPSGLEVLSIDPTTFKVCFKEVSYIIRHKANEIIELNFEGGRVEVTPSHSVIVLDGDGNLTSKRADELRTGDLLVSFRTVLNEGEEATLFDVPIGLYTVEGCTGFRESTSGQAVLTLGYSHEVDLAEEVGKIVRSLGLGTYANLTTPGYNTRRYSAVQNRYSPRFKDLLIDIAWMARISGIESSIFDETRLVWKGIMKYCKSDLLPVNIYVKFFKKISSKIKCNWRYLLRHQLYYKKCKRVSKDILREVFKSINFEELTLREKEHYIRLKMLLESDILVVRITSIRKRKYNGWVYDFSVPGTEMFWGGTVPVLLHNSDERGIQTVRQRVKDYARTMAIGEVPFKLIILDEADNMTSDAQQALRRTMELYSRTARFCLIANYPSKIIEPIQSRCAIFRFQPLPKQDVINRLTYIAKNEEVQLTQEGLEAIWEISDGDLRKAINILQSASALGVVDETSVYRVVGRVTPEEIREMITLALRGEFLKAREKLRQLMIYYGVSGVDILKILHREILNPKTTLGIGEPERIEIADLIGEINYRLVEGADEEIQLSTLLAKLALLGKRRGYR